MTPRYLRNEPRARENVAAALVSGMLAAGVGLVAFYFVRLLLSREAAGQEDREPVGAPRGKARLPSSGGGSGDAM